MDTILYLYCFASADRFGTSADAGPAAAGSAPFLLREGGLAAVLSSVPRREFCGDESTQLLGNPGWVAAKVANHTAVIEWAMRHSPVFPARFGTLFSDREKLSLLMAQRAAQIHSVLERVADRAEWAVKIWLDRDVAIGRQSAELAACEAASATSASAGANYLRERQLQVRAASRLDAWVAQAELEVSQRLLRQALEWRRRPLSSLMSREACLISNCAFLVDNRRIQAFHILLDELNHEFSSQGLRLDLSGPWPPYSFCTPLAEEDLWSG